MIKKTLQKNFTTFLIIAIILAFSVFSNAGILFAAAPTVTTTGVTGITREIAYPSSIINDDGGALLSAGYEWGTTTSYGSSQLTNGPYAIDVDVNASTGTSDGEFDAPEGLTLDASGNFFISDTGNNRVQKLDSLGAYLSKFGSAGTGNGQFNSPSGIDLDSSGNIFVVDSGNNRVQKFNSSGVYQSQFGAAGTGNGQFDNPTGIAIDDTDNIYVIDTGNNRVQKFNSSGVYQSQFGSFGSGDAQFDFDGKFNGLTFDSSGNIYVVDRNNNRVQKFNSSGVYQSQFGTAGSADGELNLPSGIAIDEVDYLYIFDSDADIQKFDLTGNFISTSGNVFGTAQTYDIEVGTSKDLFALTTKSKDPAGFNHYQVLTKISQTELYQIIATLVCNTLYHYRAFATNADGTSYGSDATFTTSPCDVPLLETKSGVLVTNSSIIMNGIQTGDPIGNTSVRGFQYGTTAAYGSTITSGQQNYGFGEYIGPNGSYGLYGATAFDIDSAGSFYIPVKGNDSIMVVRDGGILDIKLGWGVDTGASAYEICTSGSCQDGISGSGDGQFSAPEGILKDESTGNIYVSDTGNNRVQIFDSTGTFIFKFGTLGTADGQFNAPKGLAMVFNGGVPYIYVADSGNNRIQKFTAAGVWMASIGSLGSDVGEFNNPTALSFASDRTLYVADSGNNRIQSITPSHTVNAVTFSGSLTLSSPKGIALDSKDNIYISDTGNNRIIFSIRDTTNDYLYIANYGSFGNAFNQFDSPQGLVMSDVADGQAFIADSGNDRISQSNSVISRRVKPLSCGTTYHYRAFATNSDGTGYGNDESFTTLSCGSIGGGGGGPTDPILGCTDPTASNYDAVYEVDDGSCYYQGCTDPIAANYNAAADTDDGSCTYGPPQTLGCIDPTAINYNASATIDDGSCTFDGGPTGPVDSSGCTDTFAENYDSTADVDDGSCTYTLSSIAGCMNPSALNYNANANVSDGTCAFEPPPWLPPPVVEVVNTINEVIRDVTGWTPEEQINTYKDVAVMGLVVPSIFVLIAERSAIISALLRLWNIIPTLLGFRRKRRPWGTVYDSVTKQPLDPVYVTLMNMKGSEISTSITDLDGRYGFVTDVGEYMLNAKKGDYIFPSVKMQGQTSDELYDNLYFGGKITVATDDMIINKNIPMDNLKFNWNEFVKAKNRKLMKFYSQTELFLARIAKIIFIAGFVASFLLIFLEPRMWNYIILAIYVIIFILALVGVRPRKPGFIFERETGFPLSFAVVRVFSSLLKKEIAHTIVGRAGKYHVLVPKGEYYMKLEKKTGENTYEEVYTSPVFKARKGYIGKTIRI